MIDDHLHHAVGRLERAVATLEERLPALLAPPSPVAPPQSDADELHERYARLEERHAALRLRTSTAVERLSQLLDGTQGE